MDIVIFTLFPEFFEGAFHTSVLGRAFSEKKAQFRCVQIRDFAFDKHKVTDDRPYGGGPGMVMKLEPIEKALSENGFQKGTEGEKILLTSAKGFLFTQQEAREFSRLKRLAIICGHYEGVDERVAEHLIDQEIRIGDYVLTGGEAAASVIVDSVVRLLPGVLGNEASTQGESHDKPGMLGYPQYTRPEDAHGWVVPSILLSGDTKKIQEWRDSQRKS